MTNQRPLVTATFEIKNTGDKQNQDSKLALSSSADDTQRVPKVDNQPDVDQEAPRKMTNLPKPETPFDIEEIEDHHNASSISASQRNLDYTSYVHYSQPNVLEMC